MKNKTIIWAVIVIVVAIGAFFMFSGGTPGAGNLKTFTVERPDLLLTAKALVKAEVWGKLAGAKDLEKIGDMELVEGDAKGDQAWAMPIPSEKKPYVEIVAKGYLEGNKDGGRLALPYKTEEELKGILWPAVASNIGIPGRITKVDSANKKITLITESYGDIIASLKDAKITDAKGRSTNISSLKSGQFILVIGNFSDESTFAAVELEVTK